jgi:hypothetical protein
MERASLLCMQAKEFTVMQLAKYASRRLCSEQSFDRSGKTR